MVQVTLGMSPYGLDTPALLGDNWEDYKKYI
jgi:hypothetical protein